CMIKREALLCYAEGSASDIRFVHELRTLEELPVINDFYLRRGSAREDVPVPDRNLKNDSKEYSFSRPDPKQPLRIILNASRPRRNFSCSVFIPPEPDQQEIERLPVANASVTKWFPEFILDRDYCRGSSSRIFRYTRSGPDTIKESSAIF